MAAAVDVTRAEFERLLARVANIEGEAVDVGNQFELFRRTHTELVNQITKQSSEYGDKFEKLEDIGIEASFADLTEKMEAFKNVDVESKLRDIAEEIDQVKQRMTTEKEEIEQLQRGATGASEARIEMEKANREQELWEVNSKVDALQKQSKPQPSEATEALMRELEKKVGESTARSLGLLSKEFEDVRQQVVSNIDLNEDKFKKIDEQMMKGTNDRKGRIVDRKTFHSSISKFSGSEG